MREALETFVLDNVELERLEDLLSQFNIFEALGAVRVEARHSDFLAFLLDPRQNHGLGDIFLKRLLQRAVTRTGGADSPVSAIDLDVWDLNDTLVYRERGNIDILLVNEPHRFAAVIENKIEAAEYSDQLARYHDWVEREYAGFKIIYLFLSASGELPSNSAYTPIDYDLICHLLEKLQETRESVIGQDVHMGLAHYTQMLRRHIVSDSEAVELARRIYAKHKRALDFIFEQKPDLQTDITGELKRLVSEVADLVEDHCTKGEVRFALRAWKQIPELCRGQGWTPSGQLLLFEFRNYPNRLSLALVIGPGNQEVRQRLFDEAKTHPQIFPECSKALYTKWTQIMSKTFLSKEDLAEADFDELCAEIRKRWAAFIEGDYPLIRDAIAKIDFS